MSTFTASVTWRRETSDFNADSYDRTHTIKFPGGIAIKASAAPEYKGNPACVNPEEAMLAALSSCHMLTFLAIASRSGYVVDAYSDQCEAQLGKNDDGVGAKAGKMAMTTATLRPKIKFSGAKVPNMEDLKKLHDKAHGNCFIANSVTTRVTVISDVSESPHA